MFSIESQTVSSQSIVPLMIVLIPFAGALICGLFGRAGKERSRDIAAVITTGIVLITVASQYWKIMSDGGVLSIRIPIMFVGIEFAIDAVSYLFLLFASILWFAAIIHTTSYIYHEHKRTRFFVFMIACEGALMGVFASHDFFSLFVFFELMGFLAYPLVVHVENESARKAATKYIYMTVLSGLTLLAGIVLYLGSAHTTAFVPEPGSPFLESLKLAPIICMMIGFGIKAGMMPLHIWLPDAHPVAPAPASALLSGVMIKCGAYGIIRALLTVTKGAADIGNAPGTQEAMEMALNIKPLGFAVIILGIVTMFLGMLMAVFQDYLKRTLAFSSVSQMGYIIMGAGCMVFLGAEGPIGLEGSVAHVINHAFFKGCMFLVAGSVIYVTHEYDMFKMGDLWRKMPISTVIWCIAAFGICGIPLFNGFVSKTLLHHAIDESYHAAQGMGYGGWLYLAEKVFVVASGGTILYFLKTTWFTFFKPSASQKGITDRLHRGGLERLKHMSEPPRNMLVGSAIPAIFIVLTGVFSGFFATRFLEPAAASQPVFDYQAVKYVSKISYISWYEIKGLIIPLIIGICGFILLTPKLLYRKKMPVWLGVDFWYVKASETFFKLLNLGTEKGDSCKEYLKRLGNYSANECYFRIEQIQSFTCRAWPASCRIVCKIRDITGVFTCTVCDAQPYRDATSDMPMVCTMNEARRSWRKFLKSIWEWFKVLHTRMHSSRFVEFTESMPQDSGVGVVLVASAFLIFLLALIS